MRSYRQARAPRLREALLTMPETLFSVPGVTEIVGEHGSEIRDDTVGGRELASTIRYDYDPQILPDHSRAASVAGSITTPREEAAIYADALRTGIPLVDGPFAALFRWYGRGGWATPGRGTPSSIQAQA